MPNFFLPLALAASLFHPAPIYTMEGQKLTEPACQKQCARIELAYPRLFKGSNPAALARIQQSLQQEMLVHLTLDKPAPDINAAIQAFFRDSHATHQEMPATPAWHLAQAVKVHAYGERVLCLRIETYLFAGGAHGLSNVTFLNFDLQTGQRLTLKDLLLPRSEAALLKVAETQFRSDKQIDDKDTLSKAGFEFKGDRFSLPDNVGIGLNTLTFYYNEYEINSFAYGPTELVVGYYDIEKQLKPEWHKVLMSDD